MLKDKTKNMISEEEVLIKPAPLGGSYLLLQYEELITRHNTCNVKLTLYTLVAPKTYQLKPHYLLLFQVYETRI